VNSGSIAGATSGGSGAGSDVTRAGALSSGVSAASGQSSGATGDGSGSASGGEFGGTDAEIVAPIGLLYYFPFDGDTKDYSGNGNDAVNTGATPTTGHLGNANGAYLFDGATAFMKAPGIDLPVGSAARTLAVWVKPSMDRRQYGIVSWGKDDCTGFMFGVGSEGGTFWGGCDDAGDGAGVPTSTWTFLAAVFTPPNTMKVFVNDTGTTYTLEAPLNTHASSLWFGADTRTDSTADAAYFAGVIDSAQIYSRALSDAEVALAMTLP
jgi:hypothetical protein